MSASEEGGADFPGGGVRSNASEYTADKQEGKKEESINLIVKDQLNEVVHFKVRPKTRLEKVFKAYCDKKNIDVGSVRFLFDGLRVQPTSTPAELDMENGDSLDVVIEQTGGS